MTPTVLGLLKATSTQLERYLTPILKIEMTYLDVCLRIEGHQILKNQLGSMLCKGQKSTPLKLLSSFL